MKGSFLFNRRIQNPAKHLRRNFFVKIVNGWKLLTISWRRPLSYRNQSFDLQRKSMDWFLYDNSLRHERVKFDKVLNMSLLSINKLFLIPSWLVPSENWKHCKVHLTKRWKMSALCCLIVLIFNFKYTVAPKNGSVTSIKNSSNCCKN